MIRRTAVDTAASRAGGLAGLRPEYLDSSARMRAAQEEAVLARLAADDRLGLAHDFQPEPYLAFVRSFFAN